MAVPITDTTAAQKNAIASAGGWLSLFEFDVNDTTTLYLTNNTESVVWPTAGGNTYNVFPMELEPVTESSQGELPSVVLAVSNVSRELQEYIHDNDGLLGQTIRQYVVHSDSLDVTDPVREFEYTILSTVTAQTTISFTVGVQNRLKKAFPSPRMSRNFCQWEFGGNGCGVTAPTVSPDETSFNEDISGNWGVESTDINFTTAGFLDGMWVIARGSDYNNRVFLVDTVTPYRLEFDSEYTGTEETDTEDVIITAICKKTPDQCKLFDNYTRFRGNPGADSIIEF